MRRWLLGALAVVAVWAALPASADEPALRQAWTRTLPSPWLPSGDGLLYVAADAGQESARMFVSAPVVLTPSSVEDPLSAAGLAACPLTTPLLADGELAPADAPTADCTAPAALARDAEGRWLVAFDPWPDLGVAIVPALTSPVATFHLAISTTPGVVEIAEGGTEGEPVADVGARSEVAEVLPTADVVVPTLGAAPVEAVAEPAAPAPGLAATRAAAPVRVAAVGRALAAAWPSPLVVLPLVALLALGASLFWAHSGTHSETQRSQSRRTPAAATGLAIAAIVAPTLLAEATVYKLGLVLVLLTGAIGLHLLVNWAGELSLAHAPMVGLPAFVVAKLSADHGLSPIALLPLAIVVGLATGAVVGLPAIRAKGLQVALVTLAAGVAIDRFFFTRPWVVGPAGGAQVSTPTLGPLEFKTAAALYPVLALLVIGAIAVAYAIYRSKVGRALLWVKAQPDAAAAFGIAVPRYRTLAYALAGGFAGFSGGLTAMWVGRVTPEAFPLSRSFTYLIIVALAGRGFVGGVAAAAAMVEGGRLFLASGDALITYGAPLGLILTLTRHPAGLNGLGRQLKERAMQTGKQTRIRPLSIAAAVLVTVGFAAIGLAWYHAGNTSQVWVQNQEMLSGGVGGLALVVLGVGLLICDRLTALLAAKADANA